MRLVLLAQVSRVMVGVRAVAVKSGSSTLLWLTVAIFHASLDRLDMLKRNLVAAARLLSESSVVVVMVMVVKCSATQEADQPSTSPWL